MIREKNELYSIKTEITCRLFENDVSGKQISLHAKQLFMKHPC